MLEYSSCATVLLFLYQSYTDKKHVGPWLGGVAKTTSSLFVQSLRTIHSLSIDRQRKFLQVVFHHPRSIESKQDPRGVSYHERENSNTYHTVQSTQATCGNDPFSPPLRLLDVVCSTHLRILLAQPRKVNRTRVRQVKEHVARVHSATFAPVERRRSLPTTEDEVNPLV